eukprot:gene4220-5996_t
MEGFGNLNDIGGLSTLLDESRKAQDEPSKHFQPPIASNPSNIILNNANSNLESKKSNSTKKDTSIWSFDEIPSEDAIRDLADDRPCPRYEISYKQTVGTEDTILGMTDKTPATTDCTHLVIKVHFPGSIMKELDLDVNKNRIRVCSKTLLLCTYLPVDVDDKNGNAKFDSKKEVLTVTLPIIHEL